MRQPCLADLVGKPFADGGRGPEAYDCWGLALEVFRRYGVELPDYRIGAYDSAAIYGTYQREKRRWIEIRAGEPPVPALIFMRFNAAVGNHVGVYLGAGRFIHAREKALSCIERTDHLYWKQAIVGYYVPGEGFSEPEA